MYVSEEIKNKMMILVKYRLMKRKEHFLTGEKGEYREKERVRRNGETGNDMT